MSIPSLKGYLGPPMSMHCPSGNSQTLERPKQQITIVQGSQTLGKTKKSKNAQRHSAGNIDYDNLSGSQEADEPPPMPQPGFRIRSRTVGDSSGKNFCFSGYNFFGINFLMIFFIL